MIVQGYYEGNDTMNDLPGALEPMHDLHVEEKVDDDDGHYFIVVLLFAWLMPITTDALLEEHDTESLWKLWHEGNDDQKTRSKVSLFPAALTIHHL